MPIILYGVYVADQTYLFFKNRAEWLGIMTYVLFLGLVAVLAYFIPHIILSIPSLYLYLPSRGYLLLDGLSFIFISRYRDLLDHPTSAYQQIDDLRFHNQAIRLQQKRLFRLQNDLQEQILLIKRHRLINEIHDTLGHQLTGAIIQLAGLEYQVKDSKVKEQLHSNRQVLDQGMQHIRQIIHHKRDQSIQLELEIKQLVASFKRKVL